MEENVKLTKLAKCAGCGAKVGAGVLAQPLEGIQVHKDPNLLVGFPIPSARSQPPTPCRISTPWAVTPSWL